MSKAALDRLVEKYPDEVLSSHADHGDETAVVKPGRLVELMTFLRDDETIKLEQMVDVTAVDYLGIREPRFEVVYHLHSLTKGHRLRIKVPADGEHPSVPSVIGVWKAANWMEREVFDMYGVRFEGHPDLRRVLLYPEFSGHPLRKDYDIEHRQPLVPPRPGREHL